MSRYANMGSSRDRPLHFAGRRRELDSLNGRLQYIRHTGDVAGGIVLIDGVQGVGKTQLVDEFAHTAAMSSRHVSWLSVVTSDLRNDAALFAHIMTAIGHDDRMAHAIAGTAGGLTGAKFMGAGVTGERAIRPTKPLNLLLRESEQKGLWDGRVLVLSVDEVQNVAADDRETLRVLHEGRHRCPIMLVCAGLQHSAERLSGEFARSDGTIDAASISRFALRLTLAPLDRSETIEAIGKGLAILGHEIDARRVDILAAAGMDFPQHIHGYIEGAAQSIARHGGLESQVALEEALAHGDVARTRYYEERLAGMARPELMVTLAEAMQRSGRESLPWADAASLLGDLDEGETALKDAVAHGVLTKGPLRQLSFGIPSFRSYMMEQCDAESLEAAPLHSRNRST